MRLLDLSFNEPARNLALDEALLNEAEAGRSEATLRFWESPSPFVVLGLTQTLAAEVQEEACAADGVAVLRRASGGGCVLQGKGCLNFALVLEKKSHPDLASIRSSNQYILGRVSSALGSIGLQTRIDGISDLTLDGRKVSGNAQRRRRRYILHHGTLLYDTDLGLISKYLKEPAKRPDYRADKEHLDFVGNLPADAKSLKQGLATAFGAEQLSADISQGELCQIDSLCEEKYENTAWLRRK